MCADIGPNTQKSVHIEWLKVFTKRMREAGCSRKGSHGRYVDAFPLNMGMRSPVARVAWEPWVPTHE